MAKLTNITGDTVITLNLKVISESPEWIGYELIVFTNEDSEFKEFLRLHREGHLYFDNFTEPEIPALCYSLYSIAYGQTESYTFTPIDEKDFYLKITPSNNNNYYSVSLFLNTAIVLKTSVWNSYSMPGLCMNVNKENIITFSNELKREYEDMFLPKLLTTK